MIIRNGDGFENYRLQDGNGISKCDAADSIYIYFIHEELWGTMEGQYTPDIDIGSNYKQYQNMEGTIPRRIDGKPFQEYTYQ